MSLIQTEYATGQLVAPVPGCAGEMCSYRSTYAFATGDLVLNNIVEMGPLPAGCALVDVILDSDELDSSTGLTVDVGIMDGDFGALLDDSGDARTCDATIISATTTPRAGGVVRPTLASAFREPVSSSDVSIGVKIHAAPTTAVAGTLGLTVIYRG
jgi:hypothetical protein